MSDRKLIVPFKRHPYIGLFQYPWLPACARQAVRPSGYILPSNNPYIGFFNNTHREYRDVSQSTDIMKRDVYVGNLWTLVRTVAYLLGEFVVRSLTVPHKMTQLPPVVSSGSGKPRVRPRFKHGAQLSSMLRVLGVLVPRRRDLLLPCVLHVDAKQKLSRPLSLPPSLQQQRGKNGRSWNDGVRWSSSTRVSGSE